MRPQSSLRDSVVFLGTYPSTSCWATVKRPYGACSSRRGKRLTKRFVLPRTSFVTCTMKVDASLERFPVWIGGSTDIHSASKGETSRGPGTVTTGPPAGWTVVGRLASARRSECRSGKGSVRVACRIKPGNYLGAARLASSSCLYVFSQSRMRASSASLRP